jgi:hypothetical protein
LLAERRSTDDIDACSSAPTSLGLKILATAASRCSQDLVPTSFVAVRTVAIPIQGRPGCTPGRNRRRQRVVELCDHAADVGPAAAALSETVMTPAAAVARSRQRQAERAAAASRAAEHQRRRR